MKMFVRASVCSLITAGIVCIGDIGRAQCQAWQPIHSAMGTHDGTVFASCAFDDGAGPALFVGGAFQHMGANPMANIAKWNGAQWSPLGDGTSAAVRALAVFDDSSGPALYAGGDFIWAGGVAVNHIGRWDGLRWTAVGGGATGGVNSLCVFDDGSGPALYAGGSFINIGGQSASYIARWNGSSWSPVGSGADSPVLALTLFDDGSGSALYAGGLFLNAGGVGANHIAKWNGSSWSPLGAGANDFVLTLSVFDDGAGAALFVGGGFTSAGGTAVNRVAKWDGSTWSSLGSGANNTVRALTTFDDGSGSALYAGGDGVLGVPGAYVAKWNGASWATLAEGVSSTVHMLTAFDDGTGPALFLGGSFIYAYEDSDSLTSRGIVKWSGSAWGGMGGGMGGGFYSGVWALTVFDDGTGPALYAGGNFLSAGSVPAKRIAKWNGTHWSALGSGLGGSTTSLALDMVGFDDGTGPALYVGGLFATAGGVSANGFAKWNGSAWSAVSTHAIGGTFKGGGAMTVFDDGSGPLLYAAGTFTPSGGSATVAVAKWNGAVWTPLGSGMDDAVLVLGVYDDGTGAALYAGGGFLSAGGVGAHHIAKWDGSTWSPLGSGMNGTGVYCLAVHDDGSGPALFAGGLFSTAGGLDAPSRVAKWNGAWTAVGTQLVSNGAQVYALQVFDDGSGAGAHLYMAGTFNTLGGVSVHAIAKWSGSTWSPLGQGVTSEALALTVFDDGHGAGPDLFVGGDIGYAGGNGAGNFAQWQGCGRPGVPICFGDGTGAACPCANNGAAGHGCNNSAATGGALLASSGWTSIAFDTLKLTSSGELANSFSVFLQGTVQIAPAIFGDGLRCAGGNLKRLYNKPASAGVVVAPLPGDPSISARSAALGDLIAVASTRIYQVYYRDPSLTFCANPPGNTWNVSSGLRVAWLP